MNRITSVRFDYYDAHTVLEKKQKTIHFCSYIILDKKFCVVIYCVLVMTQTHIKKTQTSICQPKNFISSRSRLSSLILNKCIREFCPMRIKTI